LLIQLVEHYVKGVFLLHGRICLLSG
jgi:hypothetical protein